MTCANSKPWRVLALRANIHLGTARLLLDMVLDGPLPQPVAQPLSSLCAEIEAAQEAVRAIAAGGEPVLGPLPWTVDDTSLNTAFCGVYPVYQTLRYEGRAQGQLIAESAEWIASALNVAYKVRR